MISRRAFLAASAATPVALAFASPAFAAEPPIFSARSVAVKGTDVVAYFTEGKQVDGNSEFATEYMGATWHFASAGNRNTFEMNPEAYAPQYGGYCAYAVSQGYTASISPNAWTIHDGKLYLNFNKAVRALWSRDIPGRIASGDANWPAVLNA